MKRLTSIFLTIVFIISLLTVPAAAVSAEPTLKAPSAILVDMTTGVVRYEKDADTERYPASTTKMITAILVLEAFESEDPNQLKPSTVLTADAEVAATTGQRLAIKNGQSITAWDAVNTLMVGSCNDCAVLLAKAMAGSVEKFSDMMNSKLMEIGCTHSHFTNPHGLHDDDHYTTARDLALIAQYCMKNETFAEIVKQVNYSYTITGTGGGTGSVESTNYLLNGTKESHKIYVNDELRYCKYDGTIGIKTGNTNAAGCCLVAAAEKNGTTFLSVVLKDASLDRYADTIKLLDWGFENWKTITPVTVGIDCGTIPVKRGSVNKVGTVTNGEFHWSIESDADNGSITTKVVLDESIKAPVTAGTVVGKMEILENNIPIGEVEIVTTEDVPKGGFFSIFGVEDATASKVLKTILFTIIALIAALAGWIVYKRHEMKVKKARKAARLKAKQEEERKSLTRWDMEFDPNRSRRNNKE